MKRISLFLISLLLLLVVALPASAQTKFSDIIQLPDGFFPEGIASGRGSTFYVGSLVDGAIITGDYRTGETDLLVEGVPGRLSVGMNYDRRSGYLFVAGGPGGVGRVYDTKSGALVAEISLGPGFINDVIVTREAAYFTNSFAPEIYAVALGAGGQLLNHSGGTTIPLSGDFVFAPGQFNANGIEATPTGSTLLVVNSFFGTIYRVDPQTGVATEIDLGGEAINGDGLLLRGKTLYAVVGRLNQIAVISLDSKLTSGQVEEPITNVAYNVPTTVAGFGNSLYAVNAKFGTPPLPTTPYEVVKASAKN